MGCCQKRPNEEPETVINEYGGYTNKILCYDENYCQKQDSNSDSVVSAHQPEYNQEKSNESNIENEENLVCNPLEVRLLELITLHKAITELKEQEEFIMSSHNQIIKQIKLIFDDDGIKDEDEMEKNEKELCILILNAGMVYHDKRFAGLYDKLLESIKLQFNSAIQDAPTSLMDRLEDYFDLYNHILDGPIGDFMEVDNGSSQWKKSKQEALHEFVELFTKAVSDKRERANQFNGLIFMFTQLKIIMNQ